ncbi:uncharacterized protein N7484_002424 [Penicillium longicatenatum]|uniref:uncharacterized protein n=1 Tax=Penicillium longicatenatum TaxID=1561947 RepID=UPI0025486D4A|nr:uncharacterized protein N7484_002424 [Penicillium longicatenatum]KAJ5658775.1 hypothetical protein N7484_002424 [Penicillium longicatenatum]
MESIPFPEDLNLNTSILQPAPSINEKTHQILSSNLQKRYSTISIPSTYGGLNGPPPGTVAGIVLGSVGGVVLILYLTFLALNPGGLARGVSSSVDEEVVATGRRGPSLRRHGDTIEVVEERDRRDSYRRRPSPRDRDDDRIVVEESMTGTATSDGRDVVEVFEEESSAVSSVSTRPPRRARSHRSGVRTIDPLDYGG